MKLYISPSPLDYHEDGLGSGGIWRIINAEARWLPQLGIELVDDISHADVANFHAGSYVHTDIPIVQSLHGYYWTGDFPWHKEYWAYNQSVIEVSRRASAILSPSEWVAYPVRMDMRKNPIVIPHGVDLDTLPAGNNQGYVLWAKPRVDEVCNPRDVESLASLASDVPFISTFGKKGKNLTIIGPKPHEEFIDILSKCAVWLATARETGDIASREAMAMGIPVLAWDHGATAELVQHKRNGYLARTGDMDDLLVGLRYCLEHRDSLGENAILHIHNNFQWKDIMRRYALAYLSVTKSYPVDVSIIVPTYNYAHFLPECLDSIKDQSFPGTTEIIVVDDCSSDNTQDVLDSYSDIKVIRNNPNVGLSTSLNVGRREARGKYLLNLDADNLLAPNALNLLFNAMESRPWVDVGSGGLLMYDPSGAHRPATDWPWDDVDPLAQLNHQNQILSSSIVRAGAVERLGGYRVRQRKNEDGEYWCRAISAGLTLERVVQDPILIYRWHGENKSKTEGGEDDPHGTLSWNYYYPWGQSINLMPFASTAKPPLASWAVRSYASPHIAVIIPCGDGHDIYLVDALDSVYGQTYRNIECIVANDTGKPLDVAAMGHPWVKVVDTGGHKGAAIARNTAINAARAPLIVPLDADDMLYRNTLLNYYTAWLDNPDCIIYGDCDTEDTPGRRQRYYSNTPLERVALWNGDLGPCAVYQDTILFPKEWWRIVGGYPTDQPYSAWEDWLFGTKLYLAGFSAAHLNEPWGVYRHWTALAEGRSKNDLDNDKQDSGLWKQKLNEIYHWIEEKEKTMPCRGCRGTPAAKLATSTASLRMNVDMSGPDLNVIYEGLRAGSFSVNGNPGPSGRRIKYTVERGVLFTVPPYDAFISTLPGFRLVREEDLAVPQFPTDPPIIEPIATEPDGLPEIAELLDLAEDDPIPYGDLEDLGINYSKLDALRKSGFNCLDDLRADFQSTDGQRIKAVRGIGVSTLRQIRDIVMG